MSYKDPEVVKKANELSSKLANPNIEMDSDANLKYEIEAIHAQEERYRKGIEVAEQLTNFVNRMGNNDETRGFWMVYRNHIGLSNKGFLDYF